MIKYKVQEIIASNRRRFPLSLMAKLSEKYLKAWYNEARWDFKSNGEAFVLSRFNQWSQGRKCTIWDVGAHYGEWSEAAHQMAPLATVHSFEIIPELASRLTDKDWRLSHAFGLSDVEGTVDVHWNQAHDTENAIHPRSEAFTFRDAPISIVKCRIETGDRLVEELGMPDFLKIDTEGHEAYVLRGFRETLRGQSAPSLIQFEYGATYAPSGSTLREIYALLPGYSIGRLYPRYVEFKPYEYSDEHFRMGNMIAIRDQGLRDLLSD